MSILDPALKARARVRGVSPAPDHKAKTMGAHPMGAVGGGWKKGRIFPARAWYACGQQPPWLPIVVVFGDVLVAIRTQPVDLR